MGLRFVIFWDEGEGTDSQHFAAVTADHDWGKETWFALLEMQHACLNNENLQFLVGSYQGTPFSQ